MVRIDGPLARLMEGAFNENFVETSLQPVAPVVDPPIEIPPSPKDSAMVLRSSPTGGATISSALSADGGAARPASTSHRSSSPTNRRMVAGRTLQRVVHPFSLI
jgi:hypothetical protein